MNKFYEKLVRQTEVKKTKDQEGEKRTSPLLEVKDERTIPKLRVKFKGQRKRRWKKR